MSKNQLNHPLFFTQILAAAQGEEDEKSAKVDALQAVLDDIGEKV